MQDRRRSCWNGACGLAIDQIADRLRLSHAATVAINRPAIMYLDMRVDQMRRNDKLTGPSGRSEFNTGKRGASQGHMQYFQYFRLMLLLLSRINLPGIAAKG